MPIKAGVWENADFLRELCLALFQVASNGGALSTQARSAVEVYLKAQGHDQSWESVRHCELNSANMGKVLADMQKKGYEFTENAFRNLGTGI
ncbi:hypothetical protein LMH87_011555 [Akanthomyces muscarius]|uniref:Uncharacterized protein n=1 Tax=Akanthomyces muscarius TaxID=2231603 RepID=A0A9W8Q9E4_AKAMU|nr:hypothetical protein LMH87_011555 [Akanthomyces muscarius]KAJ4150822.1 hypothetical protein LMH87_011555 [Akanthomyces muscarius]